MLDPDTTLPEIEHVDAADMQVFRDLQMQAQYLASQAQLMTEKVESARLRLILKYKLEGNDAINPQGQIIRDPKE
jgi:hypothetical protein